MKNIENRLKKLERQSRPSGLREWWNMHPVRLANRHGNWPEKEEDERLNRHVVLIVRGDGTEAGGR
jgi:hypothetical protein